MQPLAKCWLSETDCPSITSTLRQRPSLTSRNLGVFPRNAQGPASASIASWRLPGPGSAPNCRLSTPVCRESVPLFASAISTLIPQSHHPQDHKQGIVINNPMATLQHPQGYRADPHLSTRRSELACEGSTCAAANLCRDRQSSCISSHDAGCFMFVKKPVSARPLHILSPLPLDKTGKPSPSFANNAFPAVGLSPGRGICRPRPDHRGRQPHCR